MDPHLGFKPATSTRRAMPLPLDQKWITIQIYLNDKISYQELCRIQMMKEDHQLVEVWAISPIIPRKEKNGTSELFSLPTVEAWSLDHNSQLQPGLVIGMGTDLMAQLFKKKMFTCSFTLISKTILNLSACTPDNEVTVIGNHFSKKHCEFWIHSSIVTFLFLEVEVLANSLSECHN